VWGDKGSRRLYRSRFNEGYLKHRLDVFYKYTVPSVVAQTCKDFVWLVFIHKSTNASVKRKFDSKLYNLIEITKDSEIIDYISCKESGIITTNLDSDDLIAVDYIETIHKEYNKIKEGASLPLVLSFPRGLKLSEINQVLVGDFFVNNPFISVISEKDNIVLVSDYNHGIIDRYLPVTVVEDSSFMWITTIHDKNIANSFKCDSRESALLNVCDIYNENVPKKLASYYYSLRRFKLEY
jgi:hypothetical protein